MRWPCPSALAASQEYVSAWRALARLGAQSDSLADVANESGSTEAQRDAAARITPFIRWRAAIATDDTATLRRFRDSLPLLGPVTLRAIAEADANRRLAESITPNLLELKRLEKWNAGTQE